MKFAGWAVGVAVSIFLATNPASASAAAAVAYLDHIFPVEERMAAVVRVKRNGQFIKLRDGQPDLEDRDEVYVLASSSLPNAVSVEPTVTIRFYANNQVVPVHHIVRQGGRISDHYTVEAPGVPGLTGAARALFRAIMHQSSGGETVAASKGQNDGPTCFNASGTTNDPTEFSLPGLIAQTSRLRAGPRRLTIVWRGGAAPYSVAIYRAGVAEPLARQDGIRDQCMTTLSVDLRPDRYRLVVEDQNGVRVEEPNLVAEVNGPETPASLRMPELDGEAQAIYRATWLSLIDNGSWAFEAQQNVSAMPCSMAVRAWLAKWSEGSACGTEP